MISTSEHTTSMELSFPSELGFEVIARDAVAAFARRMGLAADRVEDLKTALSEACINAIEHGNSLSPGTRVAVVCHCDAERLLVEVHDQGLQSYTPKGDPLSISDKLAGLGPLRGMGLMLIAQLTDESGYRSDGEAGNCFWLAYFRQPVVGCR
ncbi:ATP-binding protein [Candidatus Gracilibacteria bacterium]|nr:ATP-binding protein [Candidatus Gracilibacteria bacterium]